ncbi:MAG TPA: hypothetical protein VGC42_29905 [Kofleriaceae bacterium]
MRWAGRGVALAALVIGWVFIAWQNHFHASAPLVFVCLGYLAVVATVYNLWRTGASAVATDDDDDDSTWARPAGALGELERERRTLLKAIKEAEFDQQMGKLSDRDATDMIGTYKVRIYEVYAEIDRLQLGTAGSKREAILREVKARLAVDAKAGKKPGKADKKAGKADQKSNQKTDQKSGKDASDDDALEADSTTTRDTDRPPAIEPVPQDAGAPAAKEATP